MRRSLVAGVSLAMVAALTACTADAGGDPEAEGPAYPDGQIVINSPFDPGGGIDLAINTMTGALTEAGISDADFRLNNIPGGGGLVAIADFAANNVGDDSTLLLTSVTSLSASIRNPAEPGIDLLVPLGGLYAEYTYVYVPASSDIQDMQDVAESLEADPGSLIISGASLGSADNIVVAKLATELGISFDTLSYLPLTGDENAAALLGGQVDVTFGGPDLLDLVDAGDVRVIGVSAAERIDNPRVADVPTIAEQGFDSVVQANWRGLFGMPDMPDYAIAYWEAALVDLYASDEWADAMQQNVWDPLNFDRSTFIDFIAEEREALTVILGDLGLIE